MTKPTDRPEPDILKGKGSVIDRIRFVSPREAYHLALAGVTLVDLRREYETKFRTFDVPSVINIHPDQINEKHQLIQKHSPVILADNVGLDSKALAEKLIKNGFTSLACLIGGVVEWVKDGLPIDKNPYYELVGGCACRLRPRKK